MNAGIHRSSRGRRVLVGLVLALVAAQLVPIDRTNPPVRANVDAPRDVEVILRRACYDCHSNETRWPWYSRVAPMSWMVVHHVEEGRDQLNFSDWPVVDFEGRNLELHEIEDAIAKDKMPLKSYRLVHSEARLSERDRSQLLAWARERY